MAKTVTADAGDRTALDAQLALYRLWEDPANTSSIAKLYRELCAGAAPPLLQRPGAGVVESHCKMCAGEPAYRHMKGCPAATSRRPDWRCSLCAGERTAVRHRNDCPNR